MISFHGMELRDSRAAHQLVHTDWSATALGAADHWPPVLKTAVQLTLNGFHALALFWGSEHVGICNDSFLPLLDTDPCQVGWQGAPDDAFADVLDRVLDSGQPVYQAHRSMPLVRDGQSSEAYFTLCFNPVKDDRGVTQGVLVIAEETTGTVLQQRRAPVLARLTEELAVHPVMESTTPLLERVFSGAGLDFHETAFLACDAHGAVRPLWAQPRNFLEELLREDRLAAHLTSQVLGRGKYQGVTRLGERTHVMAVADPDMFLEARAYMLVVRPHPLVRLDESYAALLDVALRAIAASVFRILLERQEYLSVKRQRDERDRLYRLLFEHNRDGIVIATSDGRPSAINPAACAMAGYSEAELLRMHRGDIFLDDDGRLTSAIRERERTGAFTGEMKLRRKDGSILLLDVSSVLFRDDATGEERTINLFRDAAPRLMSESHIAAGARLEAIGQLTGGIAHDFNNLLNVVIAGAEDLMTALPPDDPAKESADLVLDASLRASELTSQLLAYSRQQPLEARIVDLAEVLGELERILSRTVGGHIRVVVEPAGPVHVRVDRSQLQSAVLNLCINARDAMADGGTLTVAAEPARVEKGLAEQLGLAPGEHARVAVEDTGSGIAPEHLARVTEPFFTTKPPGKGTGLGLSMVYGFARQSDGALRVSSQPGQGSRMEIYLPLAQPEPAAPVEEPGPRGDEGRVTGPAHLLVVEDNELLCAMLTRILRRGGYELTVCDSAEAALDTLAADPSIALVLTDIRLGAGMDGWALEAQIARRWPEVPVVTMSGYTAVDAAEEKDRVPALRKPFRPRQVLEVLSRRLSDTVAPNR